MEQDDKDNQIEKLKIENSKFDLLTVARADHRHPHHVHRVLKVFQGPDDAAAEKNV